MKEKKELSISIVGGGISGLYLLYQLVQKYENKEEISLKVDLFEKNHYFGGRIYSFTTFLQNHLYRFEAGAGRFCKEKHKRFYQLICDFGLTRHLVQGSANVQFIPSSSKYSTNPIYQKIAKKSPYHYINKAIRKSHTLSKSQKQKYSFIEMIRKYQLLSKEEATYLRDAFGYSGEIKSMNGANALHMFQHDLNSKYTYYSLSCGLSRVVDMMIKYIRDSPLSSKITFHRECEVKDVIYYPVEKKYELKYMDQKSKKIHTFSSTYVVYAIQKSGLLQQRILRSFYPLLRCVEAKPLCRIYMVFARKDAVWMNDLTKITSDNQNRYLIPLDVKNGSVMISYTDDKYASHLNQYEEEYGTQRLNRYILDAWEETLQRKIPNPIYTKVCYWKEGIAMWKPKVDSKVVGRALFHPMKNMYIIGENYSQNQAWIEGGLELAEKALRKICG
jgi:monoamine oxidase